MRTPGMSASLPSSRMATDHLRRRQLPRHTDLLALARHDPARYPFLLETTSLTTTGDGAGGHDILFAFPAERLELHTDGHVYLDDVPLEEDFFTALDRRWQSEHDAARETGVVFQGGWFLYLAYELAGSIEPRLRLPTGVGTLPVASAVRFHTAIQRDHATGEVMAISEPGFEAQQNQLCADLATLDAARAVSPPALVLHEAEPAAYLDAVARIRDWITAGDVFQVNLSRAWRGSDQPLDLAQAGAVYARLRTVNPAPFAGLAQWPTAAVISSSPERLVRVHAGEVETRPIAGTRPRSGDAAADEVDRRAMVAHPKERAEHIMLIDLERNDLGRICQPGSIRVDELMVTESYAHVHHIVSNVRGRLCAGITPGAVIRAVFPGGTITGCPKVRCMEIIAELEQEPRGPYTGSMGYLNRNGDMDLNILIRTIVWQDATLEIRAGAGIVADSDPVRELDETRAKAEGMLRALRPA